MSLQVNISSPEIGKAYQDVLNDRGINWAVFTYEKGSNDLRVQSTGDGGLEELEEEFSDGRIQYAFARVIEPTSQLPRFVQINWCGDGVPESKKGLFATHSAAVARYLRNAHVVHSARNEADAAPTVIMSKVESASGAKYSVHKEQARKFEPIAPVGTNYQPVGKVDLNELRRVVPPAAGAPKPAMPSAPRPVPGAPAASSRPKFGNAAAASRAPTWDEPAAAPAPAAAAPPPPPMAARPPSAATSRPAASSGFSPTTFQSSEPANKPSKPAEDDRIGSVVRPFQHNSNKLGTDSIDRELTGSLCSFPSRRS